jgi:L-ascorbate metabolism protein UlaG (beta-lactamase superfamily)
VSDDPLDEPAITHIGGPTVLIEVAGWRILTDPTFDLPGRRYAFGWGTASTKTAGPTCTAADVGPVDAVLLTHDHHADNLDDAGRAMLADVPIVVTTHAGARRLGTGRGLAAGESTTLTAAGRPDVDVTATPCRHGPPLSHAVVGDVIGFLLRGAPLVDGAWWVTGDTVLYDAVLGVGDDVDIDLALVHLGGVRFPITGPLRYTMTFDDGVELVRRTRPRVAVPVHYEGWSHFRDPTTPIERIAQHPTPSDPFVVVPRGVRTARADLGTPGRQG